MKIALCGAACAIALLAATVRSVLPTWVQLGAGSSHRATHHRVREIERPSGDSRGLRKIRIGPDDPGLYCMREGGISVGADRTPVDASLLVVGRTSEGKQVVVYPERYAEVDTVRPR